MSAIYIAVIIAFVFGMGSLAMDYGRVQLGKTQLRSATDRAAKWAVQWVNAPSAGLVDHANDVMADNTVDGQTVTLKAADVVTGNWNAQTRQFTAGGSPLNAVQVNATTQVPLALGRAIGMSSCTIRATSVASGIPMGIVGLDGIIFKNNTFIASYDSNVRTNPTSGQSSGNASLVSNTYIGEKNNGDLQGNIYIGPSGTFDSFKLTGSVVTMTQPLTAPADPPWAPTGNPGGIPQSYTHSSSGTLPGGTYWFTSLTVNSNLRFSGPAVVYVNGNISINAQVTPFGSIPANLKLYQLGNNRAFDGANSFTGVVIAPRSDFNTTNNFKFYGAVLLPQPDREEQRRLLLRRELRLRRQRLAGEIAPPSDGRRAAITGPAVCPTGRIRFNRLAVSPDIMVSDSPARSHPDPARCAVRPSTVAAAARLAATPPRDVHHLPRRRDVGDVRLRLAGDGLRPGATGQDRARDRDRRRGALRREVGRRTQPTPTATPTTPPTTTWSTGVVLSLASTDVELGYWNAANRSFTPNGEPQNAVR